MPPVLAHLTQIRRGEGRGTVGAFLLLFGILAGHTLLETARDALFLRHLPAEHLPWVYLAIAVIAFFVAQLQAGSGKRVTPRTALALWLVLSGLVTAAFWLFDSDHASGSLYALYIWSGLFGSVSLVLFWLVLGSFYTVTQAKRLYGFIGAGSVLGALAGAAAARAITGLLDTETLLVVAAGAMLVSGGLVAVVLRDGGAEKKPVTRRQRRRASMGSIAEGLRAIRQHAYLRRVAALVVLTTVVFTLVDYVFKSEVANRVDADDLGTFFATFYLALNAIALVVQLGLVSWLLRVFGVHRALLVLPVLLALGSGAVAVGGGLWAVLLMKGADGGLRHSLYRTSVELLYVPVADRVRERIKPVIDVLGHRGGQAACSLLILLTVAVGLEAPLLGLGVVALAAAWVWLATDMRHHYLDLFRATLREGSIESRPGLRALDLGALETLFQALNSPDDEEVLGALDLLAQQERFNLVPALILYHPSRSVVLQALEGFVTTGRRDIVPMSERLLRHYDPEVRAAVLRARVRLAPNEAELREALEDDVPLVRATALVALTSGDWLRPEEAREALARLHNGASSEEAIAMARVIRRQPSPLFSRTLLALQAQTDDLDVKAEVAWAMAEIADESFIDALIPMLALRDLREAAREALVRIGEPALEALDRALSDRGAHHRLRRHLPRTLSRFANARAVDLLLEHLLRERDSVVRYKILRGLGRIAADHPGLEMDPKRLSVALNRTVEVAFRLLDWRRQLLAGAEEEPARRTAGLSVLVALLEDKERQLVESIFRVVGLCFPAEDVEQIYRGLFGDDLKVQASAQELLDHLLEPPLRGALLALVDDVPDDERLAAARPLYRSKPLSYPALLRVMLESESEATRAVVAYHVGEVRLVALRPQLVALCNGRDELLSAVAARALELFDADPPPGGTRAS
jgi:ATP:ADP antiporter, AAA family